MNDQFLLFKREKVMFKDTPFQNTAHISGEITFYSLFKDCLAAQRSNYMCAAGWLRFEFLSVYAGYVENL